MTVPEMRILTGQMMRWLNVPVRGGEAQIIGLWGSSGSKLKITRGGTPIAAVRLRDDVLRLTIIISRLAKLNL